MVDYPPSNKMLAMVLATIFMIASLYVFYRFHVDDQRNWAMISNTDVADSGDEIFIEPEAIRTLTSAIAMLLGILSGSLHRLWKEAGILSRDKVKKALRHAEFWRSIMLTPIIFSGVYVAAKEQPDHILAFAFAFQSGFFCDAVVRDRSK